MKKFTTLMGAVLLLAFVASATEFPKYETYLGFTYVRANQWNQQTGLGQSIGGFDMYGGEGQFIYNVNRWLSGVADVGAVNKPNVGIINVQDTTAFYLFGPRVNWRSHSSRWSHWTPFGQVLFGAATRFASKSVNAVTDPDTPIFPIATPNNVLFPGPGADVTARLHTTNTAFAMSAGGGVDFKVAKHFSFRPAQVDYVLTRFPSPFTGSTRNNGSFRYTGGIIFTFGTAQ